MPKRLEYVTKLEKFTSLTIHFSSEFDKYSILYPHLKINFLEQLHNFQTKFGENSWFEKLAGNDDNSTNLKTTSNPVQNCGKSPLFRHPLPSKNCQKLLLQSFWNFEFSRKSRFYFLFHIFTKKCWVLILILVKQILFSVKFADFGSFMKKVTEFQIVFLNLEFSSNFVFSWNFAKFLLRFWWALDISSKLLLITFFWKNWRFLENFRIFGFPEIQLKNDWFGA